MEPVTSNLSLLVKENEELLIDTDPPEFGSILLTLIMLIIFS
tara:strand:+ start:131 stop:256 length:126 start_codon:yes stop_codon:yes gene_type:complete